MKVNVIDMRVLLFVNGWVGWKVTEWMRSQREDIVGVVLHPPQQRHFGDEIISSADVERDLLIDGSDLGNPQTINRMRLANPEIGLSVYFGYILSDALISIFPRGCINIHPSFLPFNRGAYTNVWCIVEKTPAGVTMHHIDAGIDTGDIIAQSDVEIDATDTGLSLYRKLEIAAFDLFRETWPMIESGDYNRIPQNPDEGSSHRIRDIDVIDEIDLDRKYTARDLINVIRARTFPPYRGAYFKHDGKKIYLCLDLKHEDQFEGCVNESNDGDKGT